MTSFPVGPPGICLNPCRLFPVSGNPYQPRPWACFMGLEAEAQRMARSQTICSRGSLVLGCQDHVARLLQPPSAPAWQGGSWPVPGSLWVHFPSCHTGLRLQTF